MLQAGAKALAAAPGDAFEREAERLAESVVRMPEPVGAGGDEGPHRRKGVDQRTGTATAKRSWTDSARQCAAPAVGLGALRSAGRPLDAETRTFMEPRFGYDFSHVRVHTDARAALSAKAIHAEAFTVGDQIVFGTGQYRPRTGEGRALIAHELVHVVQQDRTRSPSAPTLGIRKVGALAVQRRPADVVANGYHSFYISAMVPGQGTEVRVQFYQDPAGSQTATFAVWYEETGTMHRVSFTPSGPIQPSILEERAAVVTFDLDGDGAADLVLTAEPRKRSRGIDFSASYSGSPFFVMHAVPPQQMPRIVPGRGIPMGTLPNGRAYYLVPFTSHLPGGPRFVDDSGRGVNPALEFQAAATLRAAERGYLIGFAILLALLAGYALVGTAAAVGGAEAAGAVLGRQALIGLLRQAGVKFTESAIVGITRTVAGRIVWLETGTASAGLTHIMQRHGSQFAAWGLRSQQAVAQFLVNTVRTVSPVAAQSGGAFDFVVRVGGAERMVRIVIGSNGFIVTAHPL